MGGGRVAQEGEDICIAMADMCMYIILYGYILLASLLPLKLRVLLHSKGNHKQH